MVLADLGKRITSAVSELAHSNVVDEKVLLDVTGVGLGVGLTVGIGFRWNAEGDLFSTDRSRCMFLSLGCLTPPSLGLLTSRNRSTSSSSPTSENQSSTP